MIPLRVAAHPGSMWPMKHMVRFEVTANVAWRAYRDQASARWVAVCDALNVTAEADTWGELGQTIDEIQQELFLDLLQDGELDAFLRQHGWTPATPLPAQGNTEDPVIFDMPAHIIPVANDSTHAACC